MELGAFSISLSVKDLQTSQAFYEALGFTVFAGAPEHNYLIMKCGNTVIGLFQGMFEGPMLTFNPGWDQSAQNVDPFTDIRKIKAQVQANGLTVTQEQGDAKGGPASFVIVDPDGYPVLFDQHR